MGLEDVIAKHHFGEQREVGGKRYMCTGICKTNAPTIAYVWTPIPEGMEPVDMGREGGFDPALLDVETWRRDAEGE